MPGGPQQVPGDGFGSLHGCLVGSDPEQRDREQRVRRRALVVSIAMQTAIVATVVLFPLFAKPARIALGGVIPLTTLLRARVATNSGALAGTSATFAAERLPVLRAS